MKYLTDYTEDALAALWLEKGAFWAFGTQQYNDAAKEGVNYASLGGGLICPSEHGVEVIEKMDAIVKAGIKQDMKDNGRDGVIKRELYNHEAFYILDTQSTIDALEMYPITDAEIRTVYLYEVGNQSE